jgi:hypothetical protein
MSAHAVKHKKQNWPSGEIPLQHLPDRLHYTFSVSGNNREEIFGRTAKEIRTASFAFRYRSLDHWIEVFRS